MSLEYPNDLKYLDSHEYVRLNGEIATIGISAFAISELGDIVFLEVPDIGDQVSKGESFGTVESVKAVEDLKSPITGTVIEQNSQTIENPEQLSDDPYGEGWLIKVRVNNIDEINEALSAEEYRALVEGQ